MSLTTFWIGPSGGGGGGRPAGRREDAHGWAELGGRVRSAQRRRSGKGRAGGRRDAHKAAYDKPPCDEGRQAAPPAAAPGPPESRRWYLDTSHRSRASL